MKNKEVIIGAVIAILATVVGTSIYIAYLASARETSFGIMLNREFTYGGISTDIAWGTALNFIAFFGFLKFNKEERAKGVLIVTVVTAVCIMTHKLLS